MRVCQVLNDLYKAKCGEDLLKAVADGDTNAGKVINRLWRNLVLLACSGHLNKNLGAWVMRYAAKRGGVKNVKAKCNCPHGTNHRFAPATKAQKQTSARVSIYIYIYIYI
jgi:hypothetical protein